MGEYQGSVVREGLYFVECPRWHDGRLWYSDFFDHAAALSLMVSVGHRTGLFDAMASMPAATSAEIASPVKTVILLIGLVVLGYIAKGTFAPLPAPPTTGTYQPPESPWPPDRAAVRVPAIESWNRELASA